MLKCIEFRNQRHQRSPTIGKPYKVKAMKFVHQCRLHCKIDFTNKNKTQKHNEIRLQFNIFYRIFKYSWYIID